MMTTLANRHIDRVKDMLPEEAKDLKLNLGGIFASEILAETQVWGVLLTSAYFLKDNQLIEAFAEDAKAAGMTEGLISDSKAAASLMGMNTIYYRFRHLVENDIYEKKPARLRMQRMTKPETSKVDFELDSMAAAILAGCGMCINAHEASILKEGLAEDHVNEVARIAAIVHGVSIALNVCE